MVDLLQVLWSVKDQIKISDLDRDRY